MNKILQSKRKIALKNTWIKNIIKKIVHNNNAYPHNHLAYPSLGIKKYLKHELNKRYIYLLITSLL